MSIKSKSKQRINTQAYRDGYDRIFRHGLRSRLFTGQVAETSKPQIAKLNQTIRGGYWATQD